MTPIEVAVGAGAAFVLGCAIGVGIMVAGYGLAITAAGFIGLVARVLAAALGMVVYAARKVAGR